MLRTERDIPITWVAFGSVAMAVLIPLVQKMPVGFPWSLLVSLLIVVFGFFFVAVSSRIVGLIGSSSNPISGMTIATLLGTCLIFVVAGWANDPSQQAAAQAAALSVGAIVCIAAANAGATSQDLKTGYLVGATPLYQQLGLVIGVLVSVAVIGFTLIGMHNSAWGPIGSERLPAPQGTLMATIIQGVLSRDLPWGFIFVGGALAVMVQLCGVSGLAWAVGAYLPDFHDVPDLRRRGHALAGRPGARHAGGERGVLRDAVCNRSGGGWIDRRAADRLHRPVLAHEPRCVRRASAGPDRRTDGFHHRPGGVWRALHAAGAARVAPVDVLN